MMMKYYKNQRRNGHMTQRNHVCLFSSSWGIKNVAQWPIFQGLGDINISLINIYTNYAASVVPEEMH